MACTGGRVGLLLNYVGAKRVERTGVFPFLGALIDRGDPLYPEYPVVVLSAYRPNLYLLSFYFQSYLSRLSDRDERFEDVEFEYRGGEFPVPRGYSLCAFRFGGVLLGVVVR